MKKYIAQINTIFLALLIFSSLLKLSAQELIRYDIDHLTATVHYNEFLYSIYGKTYNKRTDFPVKGSYSPTHYGERGVKHGSGVCNYIYIPTKEVLVPGEQYHIILTVKVSKDYEQLQYFQDNFGIALAWNLFDNNFGLWPKHFIPFGNLATEQLVKVAFDFRPLCTSRYIVLGVFQSATMDDLNCFACQYNFELYSLIVKKSTNLDSEFHYICDAYEEKKLNKWKSSHDTDTIFFESKTSEIKDKYKLLLDSIPSKLRTVQDLVSLYAYTDKEGSEKDNKDLGYARNIAVCNSLMARGIDSSRILMTNFGETESSTVISQRNRKVEINVNLGKLYQKYYTKAIQAVAQEDFGSANKSIKYWLHLVPPEQAIYAIFECWGAGIKTILFKRDLTKKIKSKFYKKKQLKFILDSLYCESLKGQGLSWYLAMNKLPTYQDDCHFDRDQSNTKQIQEIGEHLYLKYGFPTVKEVGRKANQTIPNIILENDELNYLQKHLPLIKNACEKQRISWKYYAKIYDKISEKLTGFQRYGTILNIKEKGIITFLCPIEDVNMLYEYRKQVKLAPLPLEVITRTKELQKGLDTTLVSTLNQIFQLDQIYRNQIDEIEKKYGLESDKLKVLWDLISKTDLQNQIKIKEILDNRGWLGSRIVGQQGNNTLFLVIQHATNIETQLNYLPMLREAVKLGNAKASDLAFLEDRIAIGQGKRQIYGSQIGRDAETGEYYISPLINPESVNERRAEVGLGTIEKYIGHWGIIWDLKKHKERIKKIEINLN